jgi:hypothetical protein
MLPSMTGTSRQLAAWMVPLAIAGCGLQRAGTGDDDSLPDTGSPIDTGVAWESGLETATPTDTSADDTTAVDTEPAVDSAKVDVVIGGSDADASDEVIFVECETGTMFGGMSAVSDSAASGGKWASVPTSTIGWTSGTGKPPTRVELPLDLAVAGVWYVWVREFTRDGGGDAMYVGFDPATLRRFYHLDWGTFAWVGAEGGGTGARLSFTLPKGKQTLMLGAGEPGAGCDRVALTRNAAWLPP